MRETTIHWEWGTAYDLFASLRVLHEPGHYGLRPAWAAGVRSRVPAEHREILEQVQRFLFIPRKWLLTLPSPKDVSAVLWFLGKLPPEDRLLTLIEGGGAPKAAIEILRSLGHRGKLAPDDMEALREAYQGSGTAPRPKNLAPMLALFSKAEDSGDRYLAALKAYQRVFFAEEEGHIRPFLEEAVANAKILTDHLSLEDLIEALSRGVRLGVEPTFKEWIFVPSYWISPLVSFDRIDDDCALFMFGGRPPDVSLVSGEVVPEGMLRTFKTLGDPTRLRILRYLSQENITPAEIARRLRLRAPTVTHHLSVLRLAGLVYLTLDEKNERHYAARIDAIDETFDSLKNFLVDDSNEGSR